MTPNEELNLLLEIIKKYDLPLSPILEYAIKEKEEQYSQSACQITQSVGDEVVISEVDKTLDDYLCDFATLSVAISKGKKLPHKAVLLLSIMRSIAEGSIVNNMIPLDQSIADSFTRCWSSYFQTKAPCVWTPFYHLKGESFWHFKPMDNEAKLDMLLNFGGTPSVGKLRPVIKYAYFDKTLYELILDKKNREILENVLIENYLS